MFQHQLKEVFSGWKHRLWLLKWNQKRIDVKFSAIKQRRKISIIIQFYRVISTAFFMAHFSRSIKCIDLFLLFALLQTVQMHPLMAAQKTRGKCIKPLNKQLHSRIQGRMKNGPSLISNAFQPLNQWGIKEEKLHFTEMFMRWNK